ncbi:protein FAM81B [Hypomesus transpacificus]|uniref:protein FAM81B n=1 Tax=Hypomesus transpacificus TaxID=137520 RepID=UPI001F084600|nr:protein FAM81B [Hypomesus transpacificus]
MADKSMLQPYQPHDRSDVVEGRLTNQERAMSELLEQALRIKEEVATSLHSTQGCVQSEASSRRLLESHIHVITHIVKQLSTDIQVLERQIIQRDSISSGTSFAVQSLDHKNLEGIGDLRGRVARCDASIAKLSGDVSSGGRDFLRLQREVSELRSTLEVSLGDTETKLSRALGELKVSLSEKDLGQKSSWAELHGHIHILEDRSSSGLKQAREDSDRLRRWAEERLQTSEQTHTQARERLQALLHEQTAEVEGRLDRQLRLLAGRLDRAEGRLVKEKQTDRVRRSEDKLQSRVAMVEAGLREELQLAKQEYQSGFKSIHDAIESLRQIVDTKARLDKDKLQKDIKQIHRKVVQLRDT